MKKKATKEIRRGQFDLDRHLDRRAAASRGFGTFAAFHYMRAFIKSRIERAFRNTSQKESVHVSVSTGPTKRVAELGDDAFTVVVRILAPPGPCTSGTGVPWRRRKKN